MIWQAAKTACVTVRNRVGTDSLLCERDFFTDAPFGTPDLINSFKNMDKEFYLVQQGEKQYFVTVTDEFVESRRLVKRITADKFEIGNWQFIKCKYEVKQDGQK